MAKDKSKKKKGKKKEEAEAYVDPIDAAEIPAGDTFTLTITGLNKEQYGHLLTFLNATSGGPAPVRSKADAIDTTAEEADEAPEEVVTYTEKQLGKKERDELVDICHSLGLSESDTKGKRVNTLIGLIMEAQENLASGGDDGDEEFTADEADEAAADDDDWDEDVPEPVEEKPKKKKGKKGKKKA